MYFSCNHRTRKETSNPEGIRKKGKNNRKGGKKNENANFNDKNTRNVGGDKQSKCKVNFPCKLCKDDHLTYLFPHMEGASRFLA